jgi:hypothetical protein
MSSALADAQETVSGYSVEPALKPEATEDGGELRMANLSFTIRDHHGIERRLNCAPHVNRNSKVFVSICELGVFEGVLKPFQGSASMEIHNVVPHDDGIVIVRGFIGWDTDVNARLSVFVA